MHISGMGCGRCIGACAFDAIENINGNAPELLGRKMAEYTAAVVNGRPHFHISLITDVSPNCDCHGENDAPILPDIGMLASFDPVALDQALSYDLDYDSKGELTDACENEHGILTPQAAKRVKVNTWQNSNVEEIMKDVDCVIFPGGSDICPTLYYDEQEWHGIEGDTDYRRF